MSRKSWSRNTVESFQSTVLLVLEAHSVLEPATEA